MKKLLAIALLCMLAVADIAARGKNVITVKGSDTMVILAQRWAEIYMNGHPDAIIQVTGGGSGVGISALINGTTDICNASRPMKKSEMDKLKSRYNTLGTELKVAKDGVSLYINENNPVNELSLDQIKAIYTGQLTNWKEVGGPDEKIILYGRENSSGTYVYFRDEVLKGQDYAATTQTLPGTAAVVNAVSKDKFGIGFGGAAYGKGIKYVKVKPDAKSPGIAPNVASIKDGSYPVTRYLYMYLRNKPTGNIKAFTDWILSAEGQKIISEVGYFPVQ